MTCAFSGPQQDDPRPFSLGRYSRYINPIRVDLPTTSYIQSWIFSCSNIPPRPNLLDCRHRDSLFVTFSDSLHAENTVGCATDGQILRASVTLSLKHQLGVAIPLMSTLFAHQIGQCFQQTFSRIRLQLFPPAQGLVGFRRHPLAR